MSDDDMTNDVMVCQLDMLSGDLWLAHAYDWLMSGDHAWNLPTPAMRGEIEPIVAKVFARDELTDDEHDALSFAFDEWLDHATDGADHAIYPEDGNLWETGHEAPKVPHAWQAGWLTGVTTCAVCALMPLDCCDGASECPGELR